MATKKYVSLEKLGLYNEKIKKVITDGDTAALNSAKAYTDSLASNYDAAGAAKTVQDNLDAEILRAKAAEEANATAAKQAQDEVDALELVVAEKAAQSDLDALEEYVGTIPESYTETNVIAYINKKAQETLDAASGGSSESAASVLAALNTYKAENNPKVAKNTEDIAGLTTALGEEVARAQGVEGGLDTRIKAIEDDYLVEADKTELNGLITANAGEITKIKNDYLKASDKEDVLAAVNTEKERAMGVEGGLEDRIETMEAFWKAAQADGTDSNVIDTLKEIQEYIASDETGASEMAASIKQNSDAIDVLEGKVEVVETKLGTVAEGAQVNVIEVVKVNGEALTITDKAVDVVVPTGALANKDKVAEADLEEALATKLNGKADQSALDVVTGNITDLQGVDTALDNRLKAVEAQLGDGENSVSDLIATAKQEAIDVAAGDATTKANAAETNAKTYADGLNTAMDSRVGVVEAKAHEHTNKALLDTYTQTEANLADAVAKKHEHSNLAVLEGITSTKVTAWDAAESNAKTYADGLNTAMDTRMVAVEAGLASFVEVSEEEINALFA